eukprot:11033983-Lingulodinium_polyedra.AAC.1
MERREVGRLFWVGEGLTGGPVSGAAAFGRQPQTMRDRRTPLRPQGLVPGARPLRERTWPPDGAASRGAR